MFTQASAANTPTPQHVPTGTLSTLNVAWNRLSGPLPRYLPGLRLEYLDVARNGLGGPVAPLLQAAWSLAVLQAAGNQLNGSLPEVFRARHLEVRKGGEWVEGHHAKAAYIAIPVLLLCEVPGRAGPQRHSVVDGRQEYMARGRGVVVVL